MKRIVDVDREYRCDASKAVAKFFKAHPELADEWQDTMEWMADSGCSHLCDRMMADGTVNHDWRYSLWVEEDIAWAGEKPNTYIAVIVRE